jgi:hypothetical protein
MIDPRLEAIIRFLNDNKIRATYGAVAEVLGVVPRSMGARLGPHHQAASWIVNADTGLPSGYSSEHIHPDLTLTSPLIRKGTELAERMQRG